MSKLEESTDREEKRYEEYWKEVDKIGIDRCLLSKQECGLWFKNIGSSMCVDDEQKNQLIKLNTNIQAECQNF